MGASRNADFWTEERDNVIRNMFAERKTAAQTAEALGVSRNAVLGRAHRLTIKGRLEKVKKPLGRPKKAALKRREPHQGGIARRDWLVENDFPTLMKDMKEAGMTWKEIGAALGVSFSTISNWVNLLELRKPLEYERTPFSEEEMEYIKTAWAAYVPLEDMADKMGRTYGTLRQKVLWMQRANKLSGRSHYGTRIYKKYGASLLEEGVNVEDLHHKLADAKVAAFSAAKTQAKNAKTKRVNLAIQQMKKNIEEGMDRNMAIFRCRAEGVTLEILGAEFNITRERIRQLCDKVAADMAVQSLIDNQKKEEE